MKIAIYGAGGFGKEVACLIERINRNGGGDWQLVGFFDDSKTPDSNISRYGTVLGGMDTLLSINEPMALAIAINENKAVRRRIHERIDNPNISFPNLIDPSLFLVDPETFTIGEGNIIQNDCMISCDVSLGDFNIINDHVVVGHDNTIGSFNGLMPGAHLSGGITIGDNNLLGVASVVLQGMTIGNGITLGANSVLMTQPKDDSTYLGVPALRFDY
jgi:sugar O-acyltransferase (sialic acid O-acetyltransferase NeuD family)